MRMDFCILNTMNTPLLAKIIIPLKNFFCKLKLHSSESIYRNDPWLFIISKSFISMEKFQLLKSKILFNNFFFQLFGKFSSLLSAPLLEMNFDLILSQLKQFKFDRTLKIRKILIESLFTKFFHHHHHHPKTKRNDQSLSHLSGQAENYL